MTKLNSPLFKHCEIKKRNCTINPDYCKNLKRDKILCEIPPQEVLSYGTKAEETSKWKALSHEKNKRDIQFYGIELELEIFPQKAKDGSDLCSEQFSITNPTKDYISTYTLFNAAHNYWRTIFKKWGIIKNDGSLYNGFEFVSAPKSYPVTRQFLIDFGTLLENSNETCPLFTTKRCGLHIHISKLSNFHTNKVHALISSFNTNQITIIGKRPPNSYCRHNNMHKSLFVDNPKQTIQTEKYSSFNTRKTYTNEYRLFAAQTTINGLLSALEFVHSINQFCIETSVTKLNPYNYFQYINNNPKDYNFLLKSLENKITFSRTQKTSILNENKLKINPEELNKNLHLNPTTPYFKNILTGINLQENYISPPPTTIPTINPGFIAPPTNTQPNQDDNFAMEA